LTGPDLRDPAVLDVLRRGRIEVTGRMVAASNATLFGTVGADGCTLECVYKPVRGERPLWDFPNGTLAGREVASYLVSEAAGLHVVPPTVLRDGPGPGLGAHRDHRGPGGRVRARGGQARLEGRASGA
jgi:uncharacterized repeat protein (TIGR03843 family)